MVLVTPHLEYWVHFKKDVEKLETVWNWVLSHTEFRELGTAHLEKRLNKEGMVFASLKGTIKKRGNNFHAAK